MRTDANDSPEAEPPLWQQSHELDQQDHCFQHNGLGQHDNLGQPARSGSKTCTTEDGHVRGSCDLDKHAGLSTNVLPTLVARR